MRNRFVLALAAAWCAASLVGLAGGRSDPATPAPSLEALFAHPTADYSTAPFWVWNDRLTDEMIVATLRDLAAQHIKAVFVHPRPGLMTPYLSQEWFHLWDVALKEAARLDVKLWMYDENSYPSGFAGGFVPEAMPESRGLGLAFAEKNGAPAWSPGTLAVFAADENGYRDVSADVRGDASMPGGKYLVASVVGAETSPWYGGKYYVDLLRPGVTEKFLQLTLDAYKREIGGEFGSRVPGVFTDEPELRPAAGLPWTQAFPEIFQQRWGYSLVERLPGLANRVGDWKRLRHDYYQVLLEQFIERWGKPYYEYCERNRLEFTGHYWEHEWPNAQNVPDNMAMAAWQQRPGIDVLMNQYAEDVHAQFGNVRAVKEVQSIANQMGRARTIAEGYGAGGWDLRFEDMKRIGDWMYVLGINTMNQHLSYVSLRGARKRDHPQSFSYHDPWWPQYHASADYFARLSVALSAGQQVNDVLVIEPTTTAWMYNGPGNGVAELEALGKSFQGLLVSLEKAQVEYDLGSEDVMARAGAVEGDGLRVGHRVYRTIVLPPLVENLNESTVALLEGFLKGSGTVLASGAPPERVDGARSDRAASLARHAGWKTVSAAELPQTLASRASKAFAITRTTADRGLLFHQRRQVGDDQLVFLVNTSLDARSSGTIEAAAGGVEEWVPATGAVRPYAFEATPSGVRLRFDLPEAGSLLLRLTKAARPPVPVPEERFTVVGAAAPPTAHRVGPNVLVLDFVDVRAGGAKLDRAYFYAASRFAFQKNGVERNPWDSAVQFRDELIKHQFPAGSGVEVTYRFTIAQAVPSALFVAVERPDLYTITCNGRPVRAAQGLWWLDRSFGRIDVTAAARVGENQLVLKAAPFTMEHEIEPAYLLGSFSLDATPSGFSVSRDRGLTLGTWNTQGHPFYSDGVAYTERFDIGKPAGTYHVQLTRWYGSVATVKVNGQAAGQISSSPWSLDVTDLVRPGTNVVEVTVIGTLKNTLGPHHGKPGLGSAWPSMFQKGPDAGPPPGMAYSTVGYGMFKGFTLVQAADQSGAPRQAARPARRARK